MVNSIGNKARALAGSALLGLLVMGGASASDDMQEMQNLQRQWWQWAMSIPASHNPVYDKTGNRCGMAQRGEYWFLAGSTGGPVSRNCTIPQGVKLLVPIVNTVCIPDATIDAASCITESDNFIASYEDDDLTLKADSGNVPYFDVRDDSLWLLFVDANGLFGYKPGVYKANIARGYWGVIDTAGWATGTVHTVELAARGSFSLKVTYRIMVEPHANSDYLP